MMILFCTKKMSQDGVWHYDESCDQVCEEKLGIYEFSGALVWLM